MKRVDFEILYPDGRLKKVTFSNDPADNKHNHHQLSEIIGVLFGHDGKCPEPTTIATKSDSETIASTWGAIAEGDDYKPSLVILKSDGTVDVKCGGHRNGLGHGGGRG